MLVYISIYTKVNVCAHERITTCYRLL